MQYSHNWRLLIFCKWFLYEWYFLYILNFDQLKNEIFEEKYNLQIQIDDSIKLRKLWKLWKLWEEINISTWLIRFYVELCWIGSFRHFWILVFSTYTWEMHIIFLYAWGIRVWEGFALMFYGVFSIIMATIQFLNLVTITTA